MIENIPTEEEEYSQPTIRAMIISGSIQAKIVISEPSLVATNNSYFSKSTGRTEAGFLSDKIIVPKNLQVTSGVRQHDTHFSGATKSLSLLFGSAIFLLLIVGLANPTQQTRQHMCIFKRRLLEIH